MPEGSMPDEPRRLLTSAKEERRLLSQAMTDLAVEGRALDILEAGRGQKWPVHLDVPVQIVGVDSDPEALRIRRNVQRDLDTAIEGDLRTVDLPRGAFD